MFLCISFEGNATTTGSILHALYGLMWVSRRATPTWCWQVRNNFCVGIPGT